jgi:hypothetical protein
MVTPTSLIETLHRNKRFRQIEIDLKLKFKIKRETQTEDINVKHKREQTKGNERTNKHAEIT